MDLTQSVLRLSRLEACPHEVLEKITVSLVSETLIGPPSNLPNFLRVSKTLWSHLSATNNPALYSQIFCLKFDYRPAVRRLGDDFKHARGRSDELARRFMSLKRVRYEKHHLFPEVVLRDDLWTVYTLFIENDGKNIHQLFDYADIARFSSNFTTFDGPFHRGMEANGGWLVDNEVNALAAWLFWFTDKDRVNGEHAADRQRVLAAFSHVFVGSFKYPSTHAPITSFHIPPAFLPPPPPHTPALAPSALPYSKPKDVKYFGQRMTLTHPLLTQAALLSCVVRLEAASAVTDLPSSLDVPETRAEGVAVGWIGPTREDFEEKKMPTTKFMEWCTGDDEDLGASGSEKHEHDWTRLRTCYNPWSQPFIRRPVFTPGMLDGSWIGRYFVIPEEQFAAIIAPDEQVAAPNPRVSPVPMQFRLREYHHRDPTKMVGFDDISLDLVGEGLFRAWLPNATVRIETAGRLEVYVPGTAPSIYKTFNPAVAAMEAQCALDNEFSQKHADTSLYGQGIYDILLTAKTEDHHGSVWGYKKYYGRVRDWDGLIVLVSEATAQERSKIFSGYVHAKQNLVGRWRETNRPVDVPGWEGAWSMTKVEG